MGRDCLVLCGEELPGHPAVCHCGRGTHGCSQRDGFGDFLVGSALCLGTFAMGFDALGALCGQRDGQSHQLLELRRDLGLGIEGGLMHLNEGLMTSRRPLAR